MEEKIEPLPCPLCEMNLTMVTLDMRYAADVAWQHPPTGCLFDGMNVFGKSVPKWNRRYSPSRERVEVLEEALRRMLTVFDTPTGFGAPGAEQETCAVARAALGEKADG